MPRGDERPQGSAALLALMDSMMGLAELYGPYEVQGALLAATMLHAHVWRRSPRTEKEVRQVADALYEALQVDVEDWVVGGNQ